MLLSDYSTIDFSQLPSPCFVIDEVAVERNLKILHQLAEDSGAKVLHALKAFSLWQLAPLTKKYLSGTCSSGLHEARLAHDYYGGEVHVYSAAFSEADLIELLTFANHIVFNTCSQLSRFQQLILDAKADRPELKIGLRINPEHSEGSVALYDPCAKGSRLGTTIEELKEWLEKPEFKNLFAHVSGLHFHTLCEQNFMPLKRTIEAVEEKFGFLLADMQWLNFGGGHHITAENYQRDLLIEEVKRVSKKYGVQVYLEPGEAVAIGCGILKCQVLDTSYNELRQAIVDTSATCHMPDTLEMPYRPDITGAALADKKTFTYRIGGLTCLAGDVIGDYSFDHELQLGESLIFEDMAHYTMVKTSTFNGTKLPAIIIWNSLEKEVKFIKEFGYEDFRDRLS